jgi:hypothetical protein
MRAKQRAAKEQNPQAADLPWLPAGNHYKQAGSNPFMIPILVFSKLYTQPTNASVYATALTSRSTLQDSRSGWFATPSRRTLSFLATCRFIPALGQTPNRSP